MSEFGELAPLYGVPDDTVAVFVGGPCDGERMAVPATALALPWFTIRRPVYEPPSLLEPPLDGPPRSLLRAAAYRLVLDEHGQPSRGDDGAVRFEFDRLE